MKQPLLLPDSPRLSASLFSKLFFVWLYPLFLLGWRKDLEYEDLYKTLPEDCSEELGLKLTTEWEEEVDQCAQNSSEDAPQKKKRPSLLNALIRVFAWRWTFIGIFLFLEECFAKIAQPIFLGYLLRYFNGEFQETEGYLFAGGVVLSVMYYTTSHHPSFFSIVHMNMKIRIACSALLYGKILKLSQAALSSTTVGHLVNLLSNDVARFDFCLNFVHYLWIGPVQLMITVWILWGYYGPTCLTGVVFLILFTPFQSFMGHLFSKLRLKVAGKTDKRIRIMNEITNGIRVIKMYAWEIPFSKMVAQSREDEIKTIGSQMTLRALNLGLYYVSSKIIIFLTLVTYVLTGNYLTAEKVFVAMAVYQNVRLLMTIFFPWGISFLAETKVSIRRIEDFLLMQNYVPPSNQLTEDTDNKLILRNVSAKWNTNSIEQTLNNVNLTAVQDKLVILIGSVGAGKSSLLQAVLHELPITSGEIEVKGSIAYASQEPWVYSGSVRENILFGREYTPAWYQRVVDACALRTDFAKMAHGDKTIVGDKGISLSGGQKARISLARAVYANADIYLLDDPLSAVDAEVGRHLFERCICSVLKHKICILVTHQLQFLPKANEILLLSNGTVSAQGSYSDLKNCDINFAHVLSDQNAKSSENVMAMEDRRNSSVSANGSFTGNRKDSVRSVDQGGMEKELEEVSSSGAIGISTYWKYISIGSNMCLLGFILFSNLLTQTLYSGSDFFLQFWIKSEQRFHELPSSNYTNSSLDQDDFDTTDSFSLISPRTQHIYFYSVLIASLFIMTLVRTIGFFKICMRSSIALHFQLFYGVLRAPMLFFEKNPVGRILNRFTKDIGTVDELLPFTLFDTVEVGLQVLGVILVVSIINPIFLIPSAFIAVMFGFIRNFFQRTARNLKRLEGTARSPVYSHLSTSLNGLTTIRAFKAQDQFKMNFNSHLDLHTAVFYLFNASARWLGIVVDWISILYITAVTFGVVALKLDGTAAGLAISSALSLISWFQWGVRQSAEAENQMVSVERVLEYANLTSEAPLESFKERKPPDTWPTKGEIQFQNLFVRYGIEEEPFLKNINCLINPLEKIGIVGRTGAGKTSLISALFRLTEPSKGSILIDGVNVLEMGLHDLRSRISIIPQDSILFMGSLRKNLDPLEEYSDPEIWEVLRDVDLFEMAKELPSGLESQITEGGSNMSVGERQLICMGRAILRKNRILVMDEATANVDHETDALIQQTIRTKFLNCTVLTVAHRLHTVIDSDRIMVLDAGIMKEFDEPYTLLKNPSSALYNLVKETGGDTAQELIRLAKARAELKMSDSGDN